MAYWCPYHADQTLSAFLKQEARFMFTAVMNGCSFGIGSATNNGSRMVYHANKAATGQNTAVADDASRDGFQTKLNAQVGAQVTDLVAVGVPQGTFFKKGNIINPKHYAGKKGKVQPVVGAFRIKYISTTVGVRDGQAWAFYTLRYRRYRLMEYEH